MNFYPWHIGDYHAHTAHLDRTRDLAYRRLLDRYYLTEKPLPLDVAEAAEKIRYGETPDDIRAVERVLREFFEETPEGWRHGRGDEEIQIMQAKQGAAEERDQHEQTRQQKHRERRAGLFARLSDVGVYPAYNTKTADLEALIAKHCDADATQDATLDASRVLEGGDGTGDACDVTGDAPLTASRAQLPTPTPTPTPTPMNINTTLLTQGSSGADAPEPDVDLLGEQILNGHGAKGYEPPQCPHREILALWAEVMPDMPQHLPDQWDGTTRADHLRARWRKTATAKKWATQAEGLAYFRKLFHFCRKSPFLMGEAGGNQARRPFEFELAWLVSPGNWAKTHEGKYHGER